MAKLKLRYSELELATLRSCIYPEEDRARYTDERWTGEGFRHFRNPKVVCIEHFMPADKSILPGAWLTDRAWPPAA